MFKIQTDLKYTVTFDGESVFLLRRVCEVSQHVLNQVNQGLTAPLGMAQEKREELSSFIQEILDRTQG